MDELKERKAAERGAQARNVIDNPLIKEAFDTLEKEYLEYWLTRTTLDDVAGRERMWHAVRTVGLVRKHLQTIVSDGKLSEAQLQALRQGGKEP